MSYTVVVPAVMLAAIIIGLLLTAAWWWVLRYRTGWPPFVIDWHVRQPAGCPRFDVGHLTVTNHDNGQTHRYSGWVLRIGTSRAVGLMLRWRPGVVRRTPREWWRHRTEPTRYRIAHRIYPEAFRPHIQYHGPTTMTVMSGDIPLATVDVQGGSIVMDGIRQEFGRSPHGGYESNGDVEGLVAPPAGPGLGGRARG